MKYLHKRKIIHRDLKTKNILITNNKHVKICDFGISTVVDVTTYTSMTHGIGTTAYMAPELFDQDSKYNEKVDVYAFGVVLYFVLSKGIMPKFNGIGGYTKLKIPDSINSFSQSIIKKCWSINPDERPSFKEIMNLIVENEFKLIDKIDVKKVLDNLGLK